MNNCLTSVLGLKPVSVLLCNKDWKGIWTSVHLNGSFLDSLAQSLFGPSHVLLAVQSAVLSLPALLYLSSA